MKIRKLSRTLSILLVVLMLSTVYLGTIPLSSAAYGDALAFIDDTRDKLNGSEQIGRIIQASSNPNSANWGAEPMSFTFYLNDYKDVTLSVVIRDTSVVDINRAAYPTAFASADFYGANGNILELIPRKVGNSRVTVTATRGEGGAGNVAVCSFQAVVNRYEDTGEYEWGSMIVQGAGCVAGYQFHPYEPGILYASTDVGGAWRFDFEYDANGKTIGGKWVEITAGLASTYGQSRGVGIDPTPGREDWVYIAAGGNLLRSEDRGDTWYTVSSATGASMGGNAGNLRGLSGDNVVVIPNASGSGNTMYIIGTTAPRTSTNDGAAWGTTGLTGLPTSQAVGVFYDKENTNTRLMLFPAGNDANGTGTNGAYMSTNGGTSWAKLPGQPSAYHSTTHFYQPCKAAITPPLADGSRYVYVTYSCSHNSGVLQVNDGQRGDGCVFRWKIDANGVLLNNEDGNTNGVNVTPQMIYETPVHPQPGTGTNTFRMAGVPISALDVGPDGAVIVGTHNTDPYRLDIRATNRGMEAIFRSLDNGETWFPVIAGAEMFGDLAFGELSGLASPSANGELNTNKFDISSGSNPPGTHQTATQAWWEPWTFLHWNFGSKINPHDPDNMFIMSGMGSYTAYNLTALDEYADLAVPNARNARGLSIAAARTGLFSSTVASGTDETTRTLGLTFANRPTSAYNDFRMNHAANGPNGARSRAQLVKWETAPGLYMTVWKDSLVSPGSGRNILMATVCDYTPFRFEALDDNPWSAGGYGQWINPVYNNLFDGSPGTQGYDWRIYTNDIDPQFLPPKPADDISNGGTRNYSIFASTSRGIHAEMVDYAGMNPDIMVSCTRIDWHFLSRGGATISFDGGRIWNNLPSNFTPPANSWDPHPAFALLGRPASGILAAAQTSINSRAVSASTAGSPMGWTAINADGTVVFWGVGSAVSASYANTHRTTAVGGDLTTLGKTWTHTATTPAANSAPNIYTAQGGTTKLATTATIRIFGDRVDPDVFYCFASTAANGTNFFVSTDRGVNFYPVTMTGSTFNTTSLTTGDNYSGYSRTVTQEDGLFGVIWVAGNSASPFKITYTKGSSSAVCWQAPVTGLTTISKSGPGIGRENGPAAIYIQATRAATSSLQTGAGIYRSLDNGATWTKVSPTATNGGSYTTSPGGTAANPYRNDNFTFPDTRSVIGDSRTFGRVYVSTGNVSGGVRYGDMVVRLLESGEAADYSALDQALLDAADYGPANKYTVASFTALTNAIATGMAIPRGMTYTIQDDIDSATQAILDAISGLDPYRLNLGAGQSASITVRRGAPIKIALDTNCIGVSFTSAVPVFATVDSDGVVTGVMAGISVIRITDSVTGLSLNVAVNVVN